MNPLVSIIIPALNEEDTIGSCLEKVKAGCLKGNISYEIIVVDSSTDATTQIAHDMGARIIKPMKRGYGNAYLSAFSHANGEIIVIGDADDTYDFTIIPELIRPIMENRVDIVIGSRLKGIILPNSMPWLHQHIGNPLLTWLLNFTFHSGYSDTHSGMRAITREALGRLQLHTGGMEFASEMLIEAARRGLIVEEIPIIYYPRKSPSKLHSFADGWRHIRFILILRPLRFLILPGLIFVITGLLLMGGISFLRTVELQGLHSFILGDIFMLGGLQFLFSGIVMKSYSVTHQLDDCGPWFSRVLQYHSLEKMLCLGLLFTGIGFLSGLYIFFSWLSTVGPLMQITNAVLSLTSVIIGLQIIFTALHMSMMLLWCEHEGCGII
ncbi:glycosyltransferase family 2 protein [Methanospirillum sp. J.3.6.1-F.2.7.3]|uniref:Glycosyltransferase family 2 protein n=1 Tax=Methanospirillum purgamenti TaxID=2834276 RepID=A0A8E7B2H8_9EURY|nr:MULTISPECIES: glycosyltransferase family 2 protein [Methanospirillum]MDX8549466.1 glycosyltransferase family 2 protein [Methanospirillum hungatei]QVV89252.1 glycosyltransferase family 2 protein [Methanospirillum sp. J.3.6.1-F.2.7.3]